jgi:hypothetical protein
MDRQACRDRSLLGPSLSNRCRAAVVRFLILLMVAWLLSGCGGLWRFEAGIRTGCRAGGNAGAGGPGRSGGSAVEPPAAPEVEPPQSDKGNRRTGAGEQIRLFDGPEPRAMEGDGFRGQGDVYVKDGAIYLEWAAYATRDHLTGRLSA